jgi:cytochrome c oxidase assembly factor CtaG
MPTKMNVVGSQWPSVTSWHLTGVAIGFATIGAMVLLYFSRRKASRALLPWIAAYVLSVSLLSSDVQATAMLNYRSHMIEHLFAILVIAPLVATGMELRISRSGATLGLVAFTVLVPFYHLTHLGALVMQQSDGHLLELASFTVVGVWFWLPVYGVNRPLTDVQRLTYTFITLPVVVTTGLVLWSSNSGSVASIGMTMAKMTLNDLRSGGLVMIEWGGVIMVAHLAGLLLASALHRRRVLLPVGYHYVDSQ